MTCGECVHYRPNINPKTGRKRPAQKGSCGWPVCEQLPILPPWVHVMLGNADRWPYSRDAEQCRVFRAKPEKPAQTAPKQEEIKL